MAKCCRLEFTGTKKLKVKCRFGDDKCFSCGMVVDQDEIKTTMARIYNADAEAIMIEQNMPSPSKFIGKRGPGRPRSSW